MRKRIDAAILAIEHDSGWGFGPRFLAPASSPNSGTIVDLTASPWAIFYRLKDRGAVVWIEVIRQIAIG